jgi:fatty acid CoA ligase FadD28
LAPQGLDYVVAFLGALQAGRIAIPLSVPPGGAIDERVGLVVRDASPTAVLTTSSVAGIVAEHLGSEPGGALIEVDLLSRD